jgi:hypothetical protein
MSPGGVLPSRGLRGHSNILRSRSASPDYEFETVKSELARFLKRSARQGTWPLLQRYAVAPRILNLPPIEVARKAEFAVHIRVCERDSIMLHWAVRSFFLHCPVPCQLVIHDDGSCRPETLANFKRTFVNASVYSRSDALRIIAPQLSQFTDLYHWWRSSFTGIKWIDYYLMGESKYVIFLDTDVLFFRSPVDIFNNRSQAVWMRDCFDSIYFASQTSFRLFGVEALPQINSGLGRIPRGWFDISLAEAVLKHISAPEIAKRAENLGLPKHDDQTFNAVLSACNGDWGLLPDTYQVAIEPGLCGAIARHYVTPRRFSFYEEGVPRVSAQLELKLPRWLRERG